MIVTGDFNAREGSDPYLGLVGGKILDTFRIAHKCIGSREHLEWLEWRTSGNQIGYYAQEIFGSYPQKLTGQNLQEDIHRIIIQLPQHSDCVSKHYMKIVAIDAYTSNPGDLNWGSLEEFGELIVHDRTTPEEVLERSAGCEVVLTNKVILNSETLEQLYPGEIHWGVGNGDQCGGFKFCQGEGNLRDQYSGLRHRLGGAACNGFYSASVLW